MKVGVLGSGDVGKTLASGFLKHGHTAMLGTRNPDSEPAGKWVAGNPKGRVGTFSAAAEFGEILVLAVPGSAVASVIELAGADNFKGKTVIDPSNPIADAPPVDGVLPFYTGPNESQAERTQAWIPEAKIVKAFNSVGAARMVDPVYDAGPPTMFFCGNDEAAKAQVSEILSEFGWEPFDCGSILAARALEPLCILWCIPGFRDSLWTHAFKLLVK